MPHTSAVIIANGSYPTHTIPLNIIDRAQYIVCCDGAANNFVALGRIPDAIVGDCDSVADNIKQQFADIIHIDTNQEANDQTKAVEFCIGHGITNITIVAATGKREDHTLGNISLLAEYMSRATVTMVTDYGIFQPISGSAQFDSFAGQQVSIFCLDHKPLTTSNLRYPPNNLTPYNWWQETLNESLGDKFSISINGRAIVFRAFRGL